MSGRVGCLGVLLGVYLAGGVLPPRGAQPVPRADQLSSIGPGFTVDPYWPRPLPEYSLLGNASGPGSVAFQLHGNVAPATVTGQ